MTIQLKDKERLENATYKIPPHLKSQIDSISDKEGVSKGELVRGFLTYALEAYNAGKVRKSFDESAMEHFRSQIKVGDTVVAGGMEGVIKGKRDAFFKLEIAPKVIVSIHQDEVTEVINPSAGLMEEMNKFRKKISTLVMGH